MHPEEIKAAMRMKGFTQAVIADELEVAQSSVAQTIAGRIRSSRIQQRIAQIIGREVAEIWPNQIVLRRSRNDMPRHRRAA